MKKLLCAVFVIALAACQPTPPPEKVLDFKPEYDHSSQIQSIRVVVHPSYADTNRAYDKFSKFDQPEVYGWSAWSTTEPRQCDIHVTKPKKYDPEVFDTWGHELMHCVYGRFHK